MGNRKILGQISLGTFLLGVSIFAQSAFADLELAPPNFPFRNGEAVFVDFISAHYSIVYDFKGETVTVRSRIRFEMPQTGYPIFDLIPNISESRVDGSTVGVRELSDPDGASKFKVLDQVLSEGGHEMELVHTLSKNVSWRTSGVSSAFWMSDLEDRQYLEQYLPTNFEYDRYEMSMRIELVDFPGARHVLRTNGEVTVVNDQVFEVRYPAHFTTSSLYYHLMLETVVPARSFTFDSIDGRKLPVEIYTTGTLDVWEQATRRILNELESDYGPFPHSKVVIYGAGMGGMEYSGATISSMSALGHELFHSYNARGVMPSRGNAGWVDEAISSWRDQRYRTVSSPSGRTRMASHSVWTRMTDDDAYTKGEAFLAWIAGRMESQGKNFKSFLREYFSRKMHQTITTEMFRDMLSLYSGMDLTADFKEYVYGNRGGQTPSGGGSTWEVLPLQAICGKREVTLPRVRNENPYHPRLSQAQLEKLLWAEE